jgi:hypothetical protein
MASALQVFGALKAAIKSLPSEDNLPDLRSKLTVSEYDGLDLCKLTACDLVSRGFDETVATDVVSDLQQGSLRKLGQSLGIQLDVDRKRSVRSLVPLERLRETAGSLADEEETLEETLLELDRIRHPHRYAV